MTEVKIFEFSAFRHGKGEATLQRLVNSGWRIITAAGASSFPSYIVILQRDVDQAHNQGQDWFEG